MLGVGKVLHASAQARWEWFKEKAQTPRARMWLGIYSFTETLILPFPTDVFLALMVHADRARAWLLATLTTVTSVLGAVVAYTLSFFFYEAVIAPIALALGLEVEVAHTLTTVHQYAFLAIFLGALTPIPYTPVIIAAGFLNINFFVFVLASLLGRGTRYVLVTFLTLFFGVAILPRVQKVATTVTAIVLTAFVLVGVFIFLR